MGVLRSWEWCGRGWDNAVGIMLSQGPGSRPRERVSFPHIHGCHSHTHPGCWSGNSAAIPCSHRAAPLCFLQPLLCRARAAPSVLSPRGSSSAPRPAKGSLSINDNDSPARKAGASSRVPAAPGAAERAPGGRAGRVRPCRARGSPWAGKQRGRKFPNSCRARLPCVQTEDGCEPCIPPGGQQDTGI